MKRPIIILVLVGMSGCAHKETSSEARSQLDSRWESQLGSATKSELIEDFGTPEWCRKDDSGEESCRFFRPKGTKWIGAHKMDRSYYSAFDEILADFDSVGKLKAFKANAQR